MKKIKRGLYWGRFNPPHYGHLEVIKHLVSNKCGELVIAIGSALASHEPRNPFTGGERLLMLRAMLKEAGIDGKVIIVQVPDVAGSYAATAHNAVLLSPKFDCVFTNRPVIADVFSQMGFAVESFPDFERVKFNATDVRKALETGKSVDKLVPPAVGKWLAENDGAKRMRTVELDRYG
jgi:nicotinamide-nucleotide adenylyltransferase